MDTINLTATPRPTGKKAVKAVRREDRVPCVLYGPHQEPVHFAVERLALRPVIHTAETRRIVVRLDGAEFEAIVKDVVFHPVTDTPLHVDFQALTKGEKLTITIPVHVEGVSPGVRAGGSLSQPLYEIEIRCVPADIPGHVTVDISKMEIGDSVHVSDLQLSDAIEVLTDAEQTVVTISAPRLEVEPGEAEAAVGGDAEAGEADDEA